MFVSSSSWGGVVFLVGGVVAPGCAGAVLVDFEHRHVGHKPVGSGAVPVVLARLEEHAVTGPDDLDWSAVSLAAAHALEHVDRLAHWVGVPGGTGTRREMHQRGLGVTVRWGW